MSRKQVILVVLLICQMMFLASTFSDWAPVSLITLIAGLGAWRNLELQEKRRRLSINAPKHKKRVLNQIGNVLISGGVFMLILLATLQWRSFGQRAETVSFVITAVDVLAHTSFFWSLAVLAWKPSSGHPSLLPLGMTTILLCVAAGGVSRSLAGQTSIALALGVGFVVASSVLLSPSQSTPLPSQAENFGANDKKEWLGPVFSVSVLLLILMVTSATASVTERFLPDVQDVLKVQLQETMEDMADGSVSVGGLRYVSGSNIGSMRKHLSADPKEVALKVRSKVSPGYLRGTVFDYYTNRRWRAARDVIDGERAERAGLADRTIEASGPGQAKLEFKPRRPLSRFLLTSDSSPQQKQAEELEIRNDPFKGRMVFLPLGTRWVETRARRINVSHHNIVYDIDTTRPYVASASSTAAREEMNEKRRKLLLSLPPGSREELKKLGNEICVRNSTPVAKGASISKHFQENFGYSLEKVQAPAGTDPIAHFLVTNHDAHCEYFATATTLLLRAVDVPSRYVTGYVADELDEDDPMIWLARNRDAHAWAEAYDDETGQWFPVESTPGRTYETITQDQAAVLARSQRDQDLQAFGDGAAAGWLSRVFGYFLSTRLTDVLYSTFRYLQIPFFLLLVYYLWSRHLRPGAGTLNQADRRSQKMLKKVDRKLRRLRLVRRPSETIYQFADRVEALAPTLPGSNDQERQRLTKAADWYRRYADARYQGLMPVSFTTTS